MNGWRQLPRATALALLVIASAHCGGADAPVPQATVRDSAGIRIVTSLSPRAGDYSISAQPAFVLSDSARYLDFVMAAVFLSDGRMVVANQAAPMLRWYDATGRYRHGAGRVGGGPGDFSGEGLGIGGIWRMTGDSIAAWDVMQQRMQVFDDSGRHVRGFRLDAPSERSGAFAPKIAGFFDHGAVIAGVNVSSTAPNGADRWRDQVRYQIWSASGGYESGLTELPGVELYSPAFQQRNQPGGISMPAGAPPPPAPLPPFAREPGVAIGGDRLYYAHSDHYEIGVHDGVAAPGLLMRRATPRRAVTSELKAAYVREMLGPLRGPLRAHFQRWLDVAVYPDSLPAFARILVADDGSVWAQEYQAPEADTLTWSIFHADGAWLANIMVPIRLRVLQVSGDNVLVLARNELDVESVHLYRLLRTPQQR
jgi:hypothetical protein